jgi:hypothetical protein
MSLLPFSVVTTLPKGPRAHLSVDVVVFTVIFGAEVAFAAVAVVHVLFTTILAKDPFVGAPVLAEITFLRRLAAGAEKAAAGLARAAPQSRFLAHSNRKTANRKAISLRHHHFFSCRSDRWREPRFKHLHHITPKPLPVAKKRSRALPLSPWLGSPPAEDG